MVVMQNKNTWGSTRTTLIFLAMASVCCAAQQPAAATAPHAPKAGAQPQPPAKSRPPLSLGHGASPLDPDIDRAVQLVAANQFDEAVALYRSLLETAVASHDQPAQARIHDGLGWIFRQQAAFPAARAESEQALQLYESLHDVAGAAPVGARLGVIAYFMGDLALARSYYRKALEKFDVLGMLPNKAMMLRNLEMAGDPDGEHLLQQALEISRQIGDKKLEADIVHSLGDRI